MVSPDKEKGYDPIALAAAMEKVAVAGNRRKYQNLARRLRFYGGTVSATEVSCDLRCKFCFSDKPVRKPGSTGRFYSPKEVFDALDKSARKHNCEIISASASEGTIGRQHLFELLDLVDQSDYVYVLESNGMAIGNDPNFAKELARYKNLHVRISIKGTNPEEFHRLTGARASSYALPFKALEYLIKEKVSCNACLSLSFSTKKGFAEAKERLYEIHPGILKSLEKEYITLFPKVRERLLKESLTPTAIRLAGKVVKLSNDAAVEGSG